MINQTFLILIRNLSGTNVTCIENLERDLKFFEKKYCFNKNLQTLFSKDKLINLLSKAKDNSFYELVDEIGMGLLYFIIDKNIIILGPYIFKEIDEDKLVDLFVKNKLSASNLKIFKHYLSQLPYFDFPSFIKTLVASINTFFNVFYDYSYKVIKAKVNNQQASYKKLNDNISYKDIYKRYELEDDFLEKIENGNVEEVIKEYEKMSNFSSQTDRRLIISYYTNYYATLSILRTLARKSAQKSGLSVVKIDEICKKHIQNISKTDNIDKMMEFTYDMILDLTKNVKYHKENLKKYSPAIVRTINYIKLNYSLDLSVENIASNFNISKSYLSKLFKKETGKTITQYISSIRLKKAATLLKESDKKIQDISHYVGYPDNNYFSKVFKKYYGLSPSLFRSLNKIV